MIGPSPQPFLPPDNEFGRLESEERDQLQIEFEEAEK